MTPFKQLFRHRPDEGVFGDCWRTCVGCLINVPPEEIPHFCDDSNVGEDEWYRRTQEWLAGRGLRLIAIPFTGPDATAVLQSIEHHNEGMPFLFSHKQARGVTHTVVCAGGAVIHDPSLEPCEIVGPAGDDDLWWCYFMGADVR